MAVVCAIDVGIINMAHCVLRWPEKPRACRKEPLAVARAALGNAEVVAWESVTINTTGRKASCLDLATLLDLVTGYVRRHQALFMQCNYVVIEQQPAAKMRNLAVALYVLIRQAAPEARVGLQAASKKLDWGQEFSVPGCDLRTYGGRKKAAVALTRALLGEHGKLLAHAQDFEKCRKKDDLGDAFLHALACSVLCPPRANA